MHLQAQANFAELVPFIMFLFGLCELDGALPGPVLHAIGLALFFFASAALLRHWARGHAYKLSSLWNGWIRCIFKHPRIVTHPLRPFAPLRLRKASCRAPRMRKPTPLSLPGYCKIRQRRADAITALLDRDRGPPICFLLVHRCRALHIAT